MSRYKARHLYCSEMSSNKLWDHSLTLTYHIVIRQDATLALGIRAQRGLAALARLRPCLPAWMQVPPLGGNLILNLFLESKGPSVPML